MKDDLRAGPEDYRQLAARCAEIAGDCSEPAVAQALRALALDYLKRAAKLSRRGPIESLVVDVAPTTGRPSREPRPADGHASEREGASALKGDHPPYVSP